MSKTNRIKKSENETEENKLDTILEHLTKKYEVSKDVLKENIDVKGIEYTLNKVSFQIEDIFNDIDAKTFNRNEEKANIDDITEGLKDYIGKINNSFKENNNNGTINLNKDNKNREKMTAQEKLNKKAPQKNAPAKNNIEIKLPIDTKIKVKYNTTIVYNLGENEMEKQFNPVNDAVDINGIKIIDDYSLLPKDYTIERIGCEKYFRNFKYNLLKELNIQDDDPLLGETKFVLFVAFDVIDQKQNFDDLIGIDPLNDYKKYVLKINTNDPNLFLASGQIIFLEGDLIENGKTIEVRYFTNGFKINEFSLKYEQISPFYRNPEPYAMYCMFGPYFSKDDADLTVFNNVIREVAKKNPHCFLVNGPFFSTENAKVKYGELDTENGMNNILDLLNKEFVNTRTQIIICPGISDNENYYPVPQPPFDKINNKFSQYGNNKNIIFVSNPQIFPFNETFVGIANFDAIKDTIINSIHAKNINTFEKACEMILYQKNLYPILPNTLIPNYEKNQERTISMNLANYESLSFDENSQPDIIFINSAMKSCAIKIHGTVFINCGNFHKGKQYEQIAKITLHRPIKIDGKNDITDVYKRLKVEFIKINADNNINDNNSNKKNNNNKINQ